MKAAVIHKLGSIPKYEDIADPVPQNETQILMNITAASVKNIDKMRVAGTHYANYSDFPTAVGIDGVGTLENGIRVYASGLTGMIAEKALIQQNSYTVLPDNLDDATAAALPNALIGSAMAFVGRAKIKVGDVVLINGATGVTGKLAVQVAKFYGASKIIVTGRNADALQQSLGLGADTIISLKQEEDQVLKNLKEIHAATPIDLVIDYLWGRPVELLLEVFKSTGTSKFTRPVRIVTVGEMAGASIKLDSGILRSSAIELLGSGIGSLSQEDMRRYTTEVLPQMFHLAAEGKIKIDTLSVPLKEVESAWNMEISGTKRLVITI
ncbi:alcohol dehydrogenase [Sphingobacteriaceae bacterium]|nr:alcohol dehydrogenase [Sphingobacteriaceae bacterium]